MAALVDPRYFQVGNAFMGGFQNAQQDQRRNALMDLENRQQDFRENAYANEQAQMQAHGQAQAQEAQRIAQSRGLLFRQAGFPDEIADALANDPDGPELLKFLQGGEQEAMPADVQSALWYESATPEQRAAFNVTKRNPIAPVMAIVNGVPTLVNRAPGSEGQQIPLSSSESEQAYASGKEAAVTQAGEKAKVQVAAQADLPRVSNNADQAIKALDDLSSDPGFDKIFGVYSLAPVIPGTSQANAFAKWEQIQGKAFLEAFQSLKGGGQITEVEGQKATAAITTLANRKQSPGAARKAIKDLKGVVEAGRKRAQQKARQFSQSGGQVIDFSELPD